MTVGPLLFARLAHLFRSLARYTDGFGWRRGLRFTIDSYVATRPRLVNVGVGDSPVFAARSGKRQSDLATLLHVWREECYRLELVAEPEWVIDAGANVGYASAWFALRYPNATVVAVEPDPANVSLLRRNTTGLGNVRIVEAALTAQPGQAALVDVGQGPWAMRVGNAGEGEGTVVGTVECVTMPQLIERFGIDRVGYLKIDVEGGEVEVFQGSTPWMSRVDAIAIELHDRFRRGATRAFVQATLDFEEEFVRGENTFVLRSANSNLS